MREYQLYIDGRDVPGTSHVHSVPARMMLDDFFSALQLKRRVDRGGEVPPDSGLLSRCALADPEQLDAAAAAAARAAAGWRRVPSEQRLRLVTRFHQVLSERADEFVHILTEEGHARRFAEIEVASILDATDAPALDFYRRQLVQHTRTPTRNLSLVRKPDGVVGINPPQNAAATNSAVAVCVLAAGNAVVLRAPQSAPTGVCFLYRELVAPLLEELGAPSGTLNIVTAPTALTLRNWLDSPHIDDIFYFGDSVRGLALAQECVARGKKPILELAGNDGLVVWRDADLDAAAWALAESFIGSGQVCLVPKFGIVHPAIADDLLDRLTAAVATIRPAMPDHPDAVLSPVMKSDRYFEFLAEAEQEGATRLTGGYRYDVDGLPDEAGVFLAPTVLRVDGWQLASRLRAVREETFFPLLPIVVPEPDDDDRLLDRTLAFLESNPYGLRNSLWARDEQVIDRFVTGLHSGGLLKVNDSHIGTTAPLAAHGGTGLSGGPFGEANLPMVSTTHAQGISHGSGQDPREAVWGLRRSVTPAVPAPAAPAETVPAETVAAETVAAETVAAETVAAETVPAAAH